MGTLYLYITPDWFDHLPGDPPAREPGRASTCVFVYSDSGYLASWH